MVPPETGQPNGIASLFEGLDKGAIKNLRRKAKRDKRKAKREVEAQKKAETAERMKALKKKNKDKYDPIKGKLIRQEEKRLKALGIVPKWKKAKAEAHKRAMEEKTARKAEKKAKKQALNEQKERQRELSKKLQRKRELGIVDGDDDGEEKPSKKAKRDPAPLLMKLEGLDAVIKEGWPVFSKDNIDQKTGSYMNNKARRKAMRGYEQTVKKAETLRKRLTKQGVEVPAAPEVPPNPAEQQEMTKKERRKLKREQQEKDRGEGGSEKKEMKKGNKKEQKPSNSSSSSDSDSDSDDGSSDGEEEGGKVKAKKEKAESSASESDSDDDDDKSSSSSSDDDDPSSSDSDSESDDDDDKDAGDNGDDSSSSTSDDDSSDDDDNEDNKDAKDSSSSDSSSSDDEGGDEPQPKHQKTNKGTKASTPPPPPSSSENATKKPSSASAAVVVPPPPAPWAEVGDRTLATTLPPLTKALYSPHPDITAMSASEVEAFQTERCITLHDSDIRPILSFPQSGLSPKELTATKSFAAPSPIQAQCLPVALSGRDLVGIAATGSGKTLAFGLPALRHIRAQNEAAAAGGGGNNNNKNTFNNNNSRKRGPQVLVLAPTRELALQIHTVLQEAGGPCGIASVCIYGGVPKRDQLMALRNTNPAIAVATPGRLEDLMSDGSCRLDNVSYLVLDEADRMLDLGFEPAIRKIAGATRADRQTLMFSATWPSAIRKLASEFLSGPARVTIGSEELSAARSVKQTVEVIEDGARDGKLHELLQKHHVSSGKSKNNSNGGQNNRVIVFVLYKKEAARVEEKLTRKGWKVAAVHGDLSQAQRTAAVEAFKAGTTPLLVATDVAARGLDIPDVEVVINYSFPLTVEDYVHRIGRTGRAGKSGISHTFFVGANDKPRAGELINVLKEAGQVVPEELYKFGTTVKKKESKMYGAHFRDVDHTKKATKMKFGSDSE
jgi:ATP-dependent RNA helicase DBP3